MKMGIEIDVSLVLAIVGAVMGTIAFWMTLPIGTKSILFGAHQFLIHPWFVAWGWWKLYGFPTDWRLWVCFVVHDLGYWGLPNMDGEEGETHVIWGADFAHRWLDPKVLTEEDDYWASITDHFNKWAYMCLFHSRYWAKKRNCRPSQLCYADKLAFSLTPWWIYIPLVWLTGEWKEYNKAHAHEPGNAEDGASLWKWYWKGREYTRRWVEEFAKSGKEDTWTQPKPNMDGVTR